MKTRPSGPLPSADESIADIAARWVMRQDRGLSPGEQDEFHQWLASDPRHVKALARQRSTWEKFDRLAGLQFSLQRASDPDLLIPIQRQKKPRRWKRIAWLALPVAAAAAIAAMFWPVGQHSPGSPLHETVASKTVPRLPLIEERTLEDGSVVWLNRGAIVTAEFSPGERRIRLEHGEAAFSVAKDPSRPFVVVSGGVSVRALGTAFNVRFSNRAVEVIMTEGRVAVGGGSAVAGAAISELTAGQRATVPMTVKDGVPMVTMLTEDELARRLAWQPRMLSFNDEPLASIVGEFNRHNPVALRLDASASGELRLTARFRSDNVEGFLRLLASDFGMRSEAGERGEIILRPVH